ncbi:MAG: FKBP-type peptidyl-prolyl cis-trans isomerase [Pseudobutyrivibrio sp.]|uniref:FKBP-type peptidyl-prolyl cis-trans isomerase n=1 Tax=Pseudobutyrivibrio sp. TaxID=2014367 RepID=UPI001B4B63CE|nr:FKBP-type peptidyl-prolyl cis-trans isomerase [Pseudobutyrivibrio sp.]MBP3727846.1 FKBP-type peptidyl-prolyl cis-trans isomerase [Pseudobutyrivibrio sp.]MBQ8489120.1 FKBP-type peptidyl-prolyl cis-trans isomerase [Pseudobutyrivibrio sp.]
MKNRFLAFALACAMVFTVTACGKSDSSDSTKKDSKQESTKEQAEIEYDVNELVTLGDYKGIEVTLDGEYEYTDEGFDKYVADTISEANIYVEDNSQKEIKEDSIVNVDYVGSKDDVAFEGGSAEDQTLDVAGNCAAGTTQGYIEGFTAGLVGHKVGEEVAYEVTFPEEYGNADLAGQTVVFTFQVNYIAKPISSVDDLTDDIVSEKFSYDTVDEYIDSLKEAYNSKLESNLKSDTETAVLNTLNNNCKVSKVPEDLLQARLDLILEMQDRQYQAYGTTLKDYLTSMGYDYDEEVAKIKANVEESTKTELILEAIAKAENIQVDDSAYKEFVTKIYTQMGYSDETSFYKDFSVSGYGGEKYFKLAYLTEKASEFCVDNAVVNYTSKVAE